jgi:hypothetical protein
MPSEGVAAAARQRATRAGREHALRALLTQRCRVSRPPSEADAAGGERRGEPVPVGEHPCRVRRPVGSRFTPVGEGEQTEADAEILFAPGADVRAGDELLVFAEGGERGTLFRARGTDAGRADAVNLVASVTREGEEVAVPSIIGSRIFGIGAGGGGGDPDPDATAPIFASASVPAAGTSVVALFTEADSPPLLPASGITGFTVEVNGTPATIESAARTAPLAITLTLSETVLDTDTVTLSYSQGSGNVTDSAEMPNELAAFTDAAVTNNSEQTGGGGGETLVFRDTFTEALETDLSAHIPDLGTDWVLPDNGTSNNRLVAGGGGYLWNGSGGAHTFSLIDPAPSGADYAAEVDLTSGGGTSSADGIALRADGASSAAITAYAVRKLKGYGTNVDILKFAAGTVVGGAPVASSASGVADTGTLRAEIAGNTITVYLDGAEVLTYTDVSGTPITAAGRAGVYGYRDSASDDGLRVAEFRFYEGGA